MPHNLFSTEFVRARVLQGGEICKFVVTTNLVSVTLDVGDVITDLAIPRILLSFYHTAASNELLHIRWNAAPVQQSAEALEFSEFIQNGE